MARYASPGEPGAKMSFLPRYDHWIGGEFVAPAQGRYFDNPTPVTGQTFCEIARGTAEDVEKALDAAHAAAPAWGRTSAAERGTILNRIADRMEANLEALAVAETWENGKPIRESLAADIPLAIDHFRYFAGAIRAQEGSLSELDDDTVAYHFHEPLGVVAQIIPWNFPILMATWKLAPALAAGNAVVIKPAEQTPASIHFLMSLPVVVSPVKATFATRLFDASGLPASSPKPLTTLTTPGGNRSSISSSTTSNDAGVCSAGLRTTQLPAASAGASFQVAIRIGKFQGMIWPTTPSGS